MDRSNSHAATQNEQAARFAAEALKLRQVFRLGLTLPHSDLQTDTLKARADERFEAYRSSHSVAVLEEVIGLYEEILRQRPVGHERRAESLNDLGDALYHFCCHHEADETRNKRCIELLREALLLRPPGHPLRDQSLHNLARSLRVVFYSRLGLDILPECESLDREALQLRPPGHPERSKSLNSLAINLAYIVQHTGDVEMQAEVISMHREVLRMRPPGHPQRDSSLNNLGGSLLISFESLGGSDILAEGISLLREALKLRPVGHRLRYTTLDNLANALSQRSHYECHSESLPEAIALQREALPLHPAGHPMQAGSKMNFALFLLDSFRVSRDGRALGEAISLLREAVSSCLVGSFGYEVARQSLAEVLEAKFDEDGDMYALSEAADLHREHLYGRVAEKTLRLQSLEGLARVLWRSGSSSWPEALSCYQEARRLCPVAYPDRARLLSGMSRCFLEIGSPFFDFAEGISCLLEAYSDTYSHVTGRLRLALTDLQRVEAAYSASAEGPDPRTSPKDAERVLDLYTQIIGLLPLAANFGLDHRARLQALTGYDAIARDAAARAVLLGIPSLAVTMLEQGRGVFWMQTLHLRTSAFNEVPEDDCQELERMLRLLEHGARKVEAQGQSTVQHERELEERRQLNEAVQALLTKIRGYPGLDGFLLPPAFDALFGSLPEGFVVIVNASKLGHHALLLHRATGLATSLALKLFRTSFDCAQLKNQLPRDMSSVTEQGSEDKTRAMRKKEGKARCFDDVLSLLWTSVVQPVLDELRLSKTQGRARPRLWWCVTGELGFLPIHAAGIYGDASAVCTADYVVSSYIPTLASLTKARHLWSPISRSDLAGLLICETATTKGSMGYLSDVVDEALAVRECFTSAGAQVLNKPSAHTNMTELRSLLSETPAHVLHMACHGIQDSEPLKSCFLLQDGKLSIEDIIQLNLPQAFLAFLSACQTAKGDQNAPDQAVHLAASMLFCGFRSVVGTMWSMCDMDGPKVARQFYSSLFERDQVDLDDIAYALDDAVQVLRKSNVPASRWASFMHIGG